MQKIRYHDPAQIEGDPYDVGRASAKQLKELLTRLRIVADATGLQVRNATMTVALGLPTNAAGAQPDPCQFWEGSPEASLMARTAGALETAQRLAAELATTMDEPLEGARERSAARLRAENIPAAGA